MLYPTKIHHEKKPKQQTKQSEKEKEQTASIHWSDQQTHNYGTLLEKKQQLQIQPAKKEETSIALTCHTKRCGAFITAVLIGCLASVFTTVLLGGGQELQRGSAEATDNPVLITLFDGVSIFEPLEVHIWSILGFTFKLGSAANIDLHRDDLVPEHRFHCEKNIKDKVNKLDNIQV